MCTYKPRERVSCIYILSVCQERKVKHKKQGGAAMDEVRYYNSSMTLEEAEQYIQSGLITAARAYVANGYYLRRIRDDKLFEESGY